MRKRFTAPAVFACVFAAILLLTHAPVLHYPYFWDEMGQFVPAALDILQDGAWVSRTTLPNVHPPAVMAYLAVVWKLFGISVVHTRVAMLLLASLGVLFTFLLAIEYGKSLRGTPAFVAVLLLLTSPIFWTQSMMAQLDMPAMVFTTLALLLFLKERIPGAAFACVAAVMAKETSLAIPMVLGATLLWELRWKESLWFFLPLFALIGWLAYLRAHTGHLFGNAEFTHYNLTFQMHPVRMGATLLRRFFYLFLDNFHWIGTIAVAMAWRRTRIFRTRAWAVLAAAFVLQTVVVTVLGGAALERYLVPVLPLLYVAFASALTTLDTKRRVWATGVLAAGLIAGLFIPSPLAYPFENNLAFIDFVALQKTAAQFVEAEYPQSTVLSAWPFPDALRRAEFGYVSHPIKTVGLDNFNVSTVRKAKGKGDVLVLYSRTSEPQWSLLRFGWVRRFLADYYFYEPQITGEQIGQELGMSSVGRFERRGQWIEVFASSNSPNVLVL